MDHKAVLEGFQKTYLSAPPFILTSFQKIKSPSDTLVVYIEGDGYAWASRTEPSDDPTPKHPLAFDLATQDPSAIVVYLARPGQFDAGGKPIISRDYWTRKRYSEEVIQATGIAIDSLKKSLGVSKVSLVGYSGGAAVAVLVAARRTDVVALRTVAGNLAPDVFAQLHHVSPLKGSLDPLSVASSIRAIPQVHFVGERDMVVSRSIVETFLKELGDPGHKRLVVVEDADHLDGWVRQWESLLKKPLN
ncbi:MAG: alpha/beta hydrolase [Candidatus Omnitrophica bacterium]|nr:alpha/beta hydrolase [Candidatus Omnitrophota bacterium]